MSPSFLGRKVGPEFINKEYHDYLKQQVKQSHKSVKEEKSASVGSDTPRSASPKVEPVPPQGQKARLQRKREEMRKRGIFVQADSLEDLPTVFEKTEVQFRPYICPAVNRKLRWKKKLDKHPRKKPMQKKARKESKEKEQVKWFMQLTISSDETTTTTEAATTTEEQPTKTQETANFPPKHTLDGARKILQVAFRDKESEKILTSYENDVIVKLFSGKIPFDANVVYRQEAEKETTGINWAKILLLYPRQRSFDDGAADVFGNFTRARRGHWLWGCIFGPNDSKSFDEVDREKKSQVQFAQHSTKQLKLDMT
ncbi:unnamed protein product [Haemonchus placei]|uniref:UBX domain-containing protein n=1 Tax=Haemonchus placei TaxID=6290 RepID=A0A158QND3_HAEPC|nr:unnamed protein product [Haemonchus placei]